MKFGFDWPRGFREVKIASTAHLSMFIIFSIFVKVISSNFQEILREIGLSYIINILIFIFLP